MSKKVITFKKPFLLRRIGASIIDLILVLIVGIFISFIIGKIYESNAKYMGYKDTYNYYAVDSGLYNLKYGNKDVEQLNNCNESNVGYFYNFAYPSAKEDYDLMKKNSNLFDYDEKEGKYSIKENVTESEINAFYKKAYLEAINTYFDKYINEIADAKEAKYYINAYNYINVYISTAISMLLAFLLFPLIFKDGKTLGKLLFRLKIISLKGDFKVTKLQVLFRQLLIILLEYACSIFFISLIYIPLSLIVSFIMMIASKKQMTLHDILCSTLVVDELDTGDIKENQKIYLEVVGDEKK